MNIKNWKINVSIFFLSLAVLFRFYDLMLEIIIVSDFFISLGLIIGTIIALYFIAFVPISVMIQYKKENNINTKNKK